MNELTSRQEQVLDLIREQIADSGLPPTRAEICHAMGFRSPNAAEEHLRALARKGAIEQLDAARGERADLLRRMTGHALAGGAYWVEREMKRLGLW